VKVGVEGGGRGDRGSVRIQCGLSAAGVAVHRGGHDDGLGDGARAIGDGQGGRLGHGVGFLIIGEDRGKRAHSGESSDNISNPGRGGVVVGRGANNGGSEGGDEGGLHFDGFEFFLYSITDGFWRLRVQKRREEIKDISEICYCS